MRHAVVVWLLVMLSAPLAAQETAAVVSLADALERARASSYAAQRTGFDLEHAEIVSRQRRAAWMPAVALNASYTVFDDQGEFAFPDVYGPIVPYLQAAAALNPALPDPSVFAGGGVTQITRHQHDLRASATVTQPLWLPGHPALGQMADAAAEAARAGQQLTIEEIERGVLLLYFGAVAQQRLSEVQASWVATAERELARVRVAAAEGVAGAFEVTRAEVAVSRAQREAADAETAYRITVDRLAELLNEDPGFDVVAPPTITVTAGATAPAALGAVSVAEARAGLADASERLAGSERWPMLAARVAGSVQRETAFADAFEGSASIVLAWEPYLGGRRRLEQQRLELDAAEAQLDAREARDAAEATLRRHLQETEQAARAVALAVAEESLAARNVEVTQQAWAAGAAAWLDVEQALEQQRAAAVALALAEVQEQAARYELARQTGTLP